MRSGSILGRRQNTQQRITKADKMLLMCLQNSGILLVCKGMQRFEKNAYSLQNDIRVYKKQQLDVITRGDFNLTCGKGVTELQNLTNLRLSSFAKSHQMQQKKFYVSPIM